MVRRVFKGPQINYLGSQIQSKEALGMLGRGFGLYLTVECFERREHLLSPGKSSLTLEQGRDTLKAAAELGLETTFVYVLGLDSLETIRQELPRYRNIISKHPVVNLYQDHGQQDLRHASAKDIGYYLRARRAFEDVFGESGSKPLHWENYRSPWAVSYGHNVSSEVVTQAGHYPSQAPSIRLTTRFKKRA